MHRSGVKVRIFSAFWLGIWTGLVFVALAYTLL
jgi:hypothetical protein